MLSCEEYTHTDTNLEENQSSMQIYMVRQNQECVTTEEKTIKRNQHELEREGRMLDDFNLVKALSNIPVIKLSLICLPGQATPILQALHRPLNQYRLAPF